MGTLTYIMYIAVVLTIVNEATCRCPPRSKVPGYKQTCTSDYDCKHGMVCCPNWSNTKSCVYPAPFANKLHRQRSAPWGFVKHVQVRASFRGPRKNCDGVKCTSNEVCKREHNKRLSCHLP